MSYHAVPGGPNYEDFEKNERRALRLRCAVIRFLSLDAFAYNDSILVMRGTAHVQVAGPLQGLLSDTQPLFLQTFLAVLGYAVGQRIQ